jgi:anti-anti-sigma regulatory factor
MAANFRIAVCRNDNTIHLKLTGDFDGSSAHQLLNILKKHSNEGSKILIHTDCLKRIDTFGRDVFTQNLNPTKVKSGFISFTGYKAPQLAPERGRVC